MQCTNCGNQLQPGMKFCTKCGALNTQAAAQPPPPQRPPAPSAGPGVSFGDAPRAPLRGSSMGQPQRKSGCGKVLLVLAVIGVVGLVGVGIAVYVGYKYAQDKVKSSEADTLAIAALKAHPEAQAKLGEIKETGFPLGSFNESADGTGAAAYTVTVVGTKSRGRYNVVMRREARKWRLVTGPLTLDDGQAVDIVSEEEEQATDDDESAADGDGDASAAGKNAVSQGVLNSKALVKPEPTYPAIAKAARASGAVVVEVIVDEKGKVLTARATSGHPLLRQAAEAAAKQARFAPTLVSGKPVKVRGLLTYNFVLR